jgi:phosphopantothenate synthetase
MVSPTPEAAMSSNVQREIDNAIDALHAAGIAVVLTDHPVVTAEPQADGRVLAAVGLLSTTRTGRAIVELYDSTENVRLSMLEHAEQDVADAIRHGRAVTELRCWLHPETVAEMRAWAAVRDGLLVDATA